MSVELFVYVSATGASEVGARASANHAIRAVTAIPGVFDVRVLEAVESDAFTNFDTKKMVYRAVGRIAFNLRDSDTGAK